MSDIKRKNVWKNGIEAIVDNNEVLWLNEKHIEEGSHHKNLWQITEKYYSD